MFILDILSVKWHFWLILKFKKKQDSNSKKTYCCACISFHNHNRVFGNLSTQANFYHLRWEHMELQFVCDVRETMLKILYKVLWLIVLLPVARYTVRYRIDFKKFTKQRSWFQSTNLDLVP